jgi:uroporphyrinogen-III synthase
MYINGKWRTDGKGAWVLIQRPWRFAPMKNPLEGRTVALAESRQLEELAQLLEKEGAMVHRCPMLSINDTPDEDAVRTWLAELTAGRFAYVVLMTGEALRRLLGFAERAGMRAAVTAALGRTRVVTRGPKPVRVLKEVGLQPQLVAQVPTTDGVIATLRGEPLAGRVVGYTLYGSPNLALESFLTEAGAEGRAVLSYVYAPAADGDRVADLIGRLQRGAVDLLMITSSPQVDRLFEVAGERGLQSALEEGLKRTHVAAVGPVAAESLQRRGVRVDIQPAQGFVMKNLVQTAKRAFEETNPP